MVAAIIIVYAIYWVANWIVSSDQAMEIFMGKSGW